MESYLYARFPQAMLAAFDALETTAATLEERRSRLRAPARVAELCYFLLGLPYSLLSRDERRRLVCHLLAALETFRPGDPFCESGRNRLWGDDEVLALVSVASPALGVHERCARHLRAALYALAEFVHIGIPQYGHEVHGPYLCSRRRCLLVRSYYDLTSNDISPPFARSAVPTLHLVTQYDCPPEALRFDLTNHLDFSAEPAGERFVALASGDRATAAIGDIASHLSYVARIVCDYVQTAKSLSRRDWLLLHLRARHGVLRPLFGANPSGGFPDADQLAAIDGPPPWKLFAPEFSEAQAIVERCISAIGNLDAETTSEPNHPTT